MKKLILFILIFSLLIMIAAYHNNSSPRFVISRLVEDGDLRMGQNLCYSATVFGIFPVGRAVIREERLEEFEGKKMYHLSASATTQKIFEKLFKASVELDSFVDIQSKNPVSFRQKMLISGKPDLDREVRYDQERGVMTRQGVERTIFPNTQDPLSIFYNLKKMDFDRLKEIEMNINTNKKNYFLKGKVTPQDITIDKKLYKTFTLVATIKRSDKNPYHSSAITMVFLKDKENIPVLIKVVASGFLINARLIALE